MENVLSFPINLHSMASVSAATFTPIEQDNVIQLALEILELRHQPGQSLTKPEAAKDFLRLKLAGRKNEVFGVLFLNNKHQLIAYEEMFKGTVNGAAVYPRVVVQRALECNACALILFHNHPSGDSEPSQSDLRMTQQLKDGLELIDVRVLDHFVVTGKDVCSFAERGLI